MLTNVVTYLLYLNKYLMHVQQIWTTLITLPFCHLRENLKGLIPDKFWEVQNPQAQWLFAPTAILGLGLAS